MSKRTLVLALFGALAISSSIGCSSADVSPGGGEGWSNHVLIVMDEKKQLWGFSMGYSE